MTDAPSPLSVKSAATDPYLLEMLVCPITKTTLRYDAARQRLISDAAKLSFPIRDGIPVLLINEAESLNLS